MRAAALPVDDRCVRAWRQRPYRETLRLRDGRSVSLRPMHHGDATALHRFLFASLSPRSRLARFHGAVNHLPDAALRAMTTQVPHRHVALVALANTDEGEPRILADARYVVEDGGTAELAIAVADAWQGLGLGRGLLLRLAAFARAHGVAALHGAVLPGNEPMLRLMRSLGAELQGHGAEVQATISW